MAKDQVTTVKDAVHKLQLALLEGIKDQSLLYATGSLMSKGDYQDVVTERTIANMCGYPLCGNSLPSERPWKGRYRIALKEHKVYDLQETYMYCSTNCIVNSNTFSAVLPAERCSEFNPSRINEVLSLFKGQSSELVVEEAMGKERDFGFSNLKIEEKTGTKGGEVVSLEDWIGPSNAIEGYVPKRDHSVKASHSKTYVKGSECSDFESVILNGDVSAGLKTIPVKSDETFELLPFGTRQKSKCLPIKKRYNKTGEKCGVSGKPLQNKGSCGNSQLNKSKQGHKPKSLTQKKEADKNFFNTDFMSAIITEDEYSVSKPLSGMSMNDVGEISKEPKGKVIQKEAGDISLGVDKPSTSKQIDSKSKSIDSTTVQKHASSDCKIVLGESTVNPDQACTIDPGEAIETSKTLNKSSLRPSGLIKSGRKVSWADENKTGSNVGDLCEFNEANSSEELPVTFGENDSPRIASANAVAVALSQAAEAVASGQSDVADAVSEAGIVVMPEPKSTGNEVDGEVDIVESKQAPLKWPKISEVSSTDVLDSDDSWFDTAPEGFSLTLSPFATMWNSIFTWMTCSSLAYIYGKDDSFHEEYLFCNGREYPRKIVLPDGRSSEIKQTMDGILARALPSLNDELKLATPHSVLAKELGCLLETMSFMEALPPFRHIQWEVISLLFLEALSIHRIPSLATQLTNKRGSIPKVLNGAKMSIEDYNFLKDIILPFNN